MEYINTVQNNQNHDRQDTLQKIKEYILSLLIKKQSKAKELEELLEDTPETKEISEEKSIWDKVKEKIVHEDHPAPTKKENQKPHESQLESAPEDQDEYIPRNSEFGESL
jgi:hypothetical protein